MVKLTFHVILLSIEKYFCKTILFLIFLAVMLKINQTDISYDKYKKKK